MPKARPRSASAPTASRRSPAPVPPANGHWRAAFAVPRDVLEHGDGPLTLELDGDTVTLPRILPGPEARPVLGPLGPVAGAPALPDHAGDEPLDGAQVLVVDDDELIRLAVAATLEQEGCTVTMAEDGADALRRLEEALPDLIVSDVMMPDVDGLSLVARVRANPRTQGIPLIFLTSKRASGDVIAGLELGADDYLSKPFRPEELAARVRAKLARRPVPAEMLRFDPRTGVLAAQVMRDELAREIERAARGGAPGAFALLELDEVPAIRTRLGDRAEDAIAQQLATLVADEEHPLDVVGRLDRGRFGLLLPEAGEREAQQRLDEISRHIVRARFEVAGERLHLTPTIGFVDYRGDADAKTVEHDAAAALAHAASHLDVRPTAFTPEMALALHEAESTQAPERAARAARHPAADPRDPGPRARAAVLRVLGPGQRRPRHHLAGVPRRRRRAARDRDDDLDRGLPRAAPPGPAGGARRAVPDRHRDHRRVPAQRGGDDRRDRRVVPRPGLPRRAAGRPGLQHAARPPDRGRAARDRRARPAVRPVPRRALDLQGAERQRGARDGRRRDGRGVRRRPPARAGRLRPRVALAVQRPRPRAGPLRRAQRRRQLGQPHGRRRVRVDLRRQPPGPRAAARLRHLRRHQRLLAGGRAARDPHARLDAHRGHRLVDARRRGGRPHRVRPAAHLARARPRDAARAVEPADALGAGLVPGLDDPPVARPALAQAQPAPEGRPVLPAGLARDLPVDLAADVPDRRLLDDQGRRRRLARAAVRRDDDLHAGDRPGAGVLRVPSRRPGDQAAQAAGSPCTSLVATVFFTEFKNVIARVAQIKELVGERHWKVTPRG